jgi:hypothetical protein
MTPFDPARPRTAGGAPAWRDAAMLVLPSLVLTPTEDALVWDLKFMFPSGEHSNAFHWVGKKFEIKNRGDFPPELVDFLTDWEEGPEEAIKKWLDLDAPSGKWWRLPPRDAADAELETTKTLEDLGL